MMQVVNGSNAGKRVSRRWKVSRIEEGRGKSVSGSGHTIFRYDYWISSVVSFFWLRSIGSNKCTGLAREGDIPRRALV